MMSNNRKKKGVADNGLLDMALHYYGLDESSGTDISDSLGSNDGIVAGSTLGQSAPANLGTSILFAGANSSYIKLNSSPTFTDSTKYSFSAWVKLLSVTETGYVLALRNNSSSSPQIAIYLQNNNIFFYNNDGSTYSTQASSPFLSTSLWYHICAIRDGGSQYIYVNGVLAGSSTYTIGTISFNNFYIGTSYRNGSFYNPINAYIADIVVYDGVLSSDQIGQLYKGGDGLSFEQYT